MLKLARPVRVALIASIALLVTGCAAFWKALPLIEQAACAIVPALAPNSTSLVGSVCRDALPAVNTVLGALASEIGAETVARSAKGCKLVPISADGVTGQGVVCSYLCGSGATDADPCPRVDAELRALVAVRAGQ